MEQRRKLNSTKSSCDTPSPVLLRRRLSAPETVMRKYNLARARSQDSDPGHSHDSKFGDLSNTVHSGSDLSLQKKKDSAVLMRKSTILRRLMTNPKTYGSSSFQEWQHYCGKLSTPSLNSLQGSPEHLSKSYSRRSLVGYEFKTSPKHSYGSRKVSPVHQLYEPQKSSLTQNTNTSPRRIIDSSCDNYANQQSYHSHSTNRISSQKMTTIDQHIASVRTTHSDSAYSNDRSNFSPASISSCSTNTNLTTQKSSRYKNDTKNLDQGIVDENRNFSVNTSFNYVTQESSTQTSSTTNLNVISNVKLSQKTLDLIVNEVMRDVQCTNGNEVQDKTGDAIHVQKISGLKPTRHGTINNVYRDDSVMHKNDTDFKEQRTSSSRLSGISSKTSLGVKSENFMDDNSDIISIADSLEDTTSSKLSVKNHDNKPVRGDLPPLPTKYQKNSTKNLKPADSFFVSMKTDIADEVKSVSDYLPKKLKDKIWQRQQTLQERVNHNKTENTTPIKLRQNGKNHLTNSENSKLNKIKNKIRYKKPFLPSLVSTEKLKIENNDKKLENSKIKNKFKRKSKIQSTRKADVLQNLSETNFRVYTTQNEYQYDGAPRKIYHKSEFKNFNKRVEILEIMECVDLSDRQNQSSTKSKSKIPVLVSQNLTSVSPKKPTYLDFNQMVISDPKLDQLIANILIQSLQEKGGSTTMKPQCQDEPNDTPEGRTVKDDKEFAVIPEELSQQTSSEEKENTPNSVNVTNEKNIKVIEELRKINSTSNQVPQTKNIENNYKGKAALELPKPDNFSTIPDGWVAFHTLQKSEESIDTSTHEGQKQDFRRIEGAGREPYQDRLPPENKRNYRTLHERIHEEYDFERTTAREEGLKGVTIPPPLPKKYGSPSRRSKYKSMPNGQQPPGEWSIVLSGNNSASFASDLEMKIRFPSSRHINTSHQQPEPEEDRENNQMYEGTFFPRIDHRYLNGYSRRNSYYNENIGEYRKLPDIKKRQPENEKVSDQIALAAIEIDDIRPRQTKTSLRRYKMTRPKLHPLFESNIYDVNLDRQYPEILRRFPQLLTVNGNSISPERKNSVPGISRRDVPKHNYAPN
ncbi:hypothetical protein HHI36_023592 [Cryptolaemus montrouzieri]|uniref:Uncharacterized protein n=1 Tax=Cryptolaemus montrouzieri TaxID=559131 RepID=A0ABD2PHD3_9CUCU